MDSTAQTVLVILTVLGSYWAIHRDMASLRECVARLEGMMEAQFSKPAE